MAGQNTHTPRVVVATGASAGVGRATARECAAQGNSEKFRHSRRALEGESHNVSLE